MELLQEYFDTALDSKDGIKKLREMILTLAMKGKLVPQNPTDQPAGELIKEIQAEKAKLIKDGKIKKQKDLPPIKLEEIPYHLPESWEWVRLDTISEYIQRGKGPDYTEISDYPVISQKCIQWAGFDKSVVKFITADSLTKYTSERFIIKGDLLWNSTGTGTIGRINLYNGELDDFKKVVADSHVTVIRIIKTNQRYALYYFTSPFVQDNIENNASGTTNQIELNTSTVSNHIIPLPPLAEQKKIVEKIDSLMAKCDELEKLKKEREQKRLDVHKSAVHALLNSGDVKESWQFIKSNFSELYTVKENVAELCKAILQLAMMGKLVPQDPADQPASELLKEIQAEKAKLIKEGKIKKQKDLPSIKPEEIPYPLPSSWTWVRLGELFKVTSGSNLTKEKMQNGNIPVYGGNGITGFHNEANISEPTIVIGRVGYYCGSVHLTKSSAWVTDNAFITSFDTNRLYIKFIIHLLKFTNLQTDTSATAQPVISGSKIYPLLLSIPPLAEQKRIVAKIDSLMAMCDELEKQITESENKKSTLLNSLTAQV